MSDHPIRIGVIGCGAIARSHFNAYAELGEEAAIVATLCDLDEERLARAAERWPGARTTRDFEQMLAPGDLDMVLVATMPDTHAQMAIAALEAGAHVFCEKPFATSIEEATAILDTAVRVERQVQLGTNMRYLPSSLYLRDLVASGEVGDPLFCRASAYHLNPPWWGPHYQRARSGGGVLASTLVHVLDLGMWIAGSPNPVSATATAHRTFPAKRGPQVSEEVRASYDVEDICNALVRFDNGMVCVLEGNWCCEGREGTSVELVTTQGTLSNAPFSVLVDEEGEIVDKTPAGESDTWEVEANWQRSINDESADVIARLRHNQPWTQHDRRQLLNLQHIIDACYESARTGRQIDLCNSSA